MAMGDEVDWLGIGDDVAPMGGWVEGPPRMEVQVSGPLHVFQDFIQITVGGMDIHDILRPFAEKRVELTVREVQ